MLYDDNGGPPASVHAKQRGDDSSKPSRMKHDFKKVNGLRKLVNALIQEAQDATATGRNRDKAINNALKPLSSPKVRLSELKRFANGDTLLPKQYSAVFAVITRWVKEDNIPPVWRAEQPKEPEQSSTSLKPANDELKSQPESVEPAEAAPVFSAEDEEWLSRAEAAVPPAFRLLNG